MVRRAEPREEPETLLDIVRRARVLARALSEPDRSRILDYVRELEAEVASLVAANGRSGERNEKARSQKPRRRTERPVPALKPPGARALRK